MHHSREPCRAVAQDALQRNELFSLELISRLVGHLIDVIGKSVVLPPPRYLCPAHLRRSEPAHLQVVSQDPRATGQLAVVLEPAPPPVRHYLQ